MLFWIRGRAAFQKKRSHSTLGIKEIDRDVNTVFEMLEEMGKRKKDRCCLSSVIKTAAFGKWMRTYQNRYIRNGKKERRKDMKRKKTVAEGLCDEQLLREMAEWEPEII